MSEDQAWIVDPASAKFKAIIELYADGDQEFVIEFTNRCINNYLEFLERLKTAIESNDWAVLKSVKHKYHALNEMFHMHRLTEMMELLESFKSDFAMQPVLIRQIESDIHDMIKALKTIKYL